MHASEPPLGGKKIDDGQDGSVYVWVVDGTGKLVVPKEEHGQFYRKKWYEVDGIGLFLISICLILFVCLFFVCL
jgi:hypothetical protein